MKAVVLFDLGKYEIREVDKPACPPKGLLVEVLYVGLCGSDLRTLFSGHRNIKLPAILGHEVSGRVAELGPEYAGGYKTGDILAVAPDVYCGNCSFCKAGKFEFCENLRELAQHWPGGFAEYMAIPPEALALGVISPIPAGLSPAQATLAEPSSSCISAQEKLGIGFGDTVLIIGSGPIGCIHTCLARAHGARTVIVADIKDDRLHMCKSFGADYTVNSSRESLEESVKKLTSGRGPDVVITANPVAQTQIQAVNLVARGGRIAFFGGLPQGRSQVTLDTNQIHYKGVTVIGTNGFAPRHFQTALELTAQGKILADKLVTHILPLGDFAKGVDLAREGKAIKVVYQAR